MAPGSESSPATTWSLKFILIPGMLWLTPYEEPPAGGRLRSRALPQQSAAVAPLLSPPFPSQTKPPAGGNPLVFLSFSWTHPGRP